MSFYNTGLEEKTQEENSGRGIGFIDTDNLLHSTPSLSSYTATEDCWVSCYGNIFINNIQISVIDVTRITFIPLKKGQTIKTLYSGSEAPYITKIYGMKY